MQTQSSEESLYSSEHPWPASLPPFIPHLRIPCLLWSSVLTTATWCAVVHIVGPEWQVLVSAVDGSADSVVIFPTCIHPEMQLSPSLLSTVKLMDSSLPFWWARKRSELCTTTSSCHSEPKWQLSGLWWLEHISCPLQVCNKQRKRSRLMIHWGAQTPFLLCLHVHLAGEEVEDQRLKTSLTLSYIHQWPLWGDQMNPKAPGDAAGRVQSSENWLADASTPGSALVCTLVWLEGVLNNIWVNPAMLWTMVTSKHPSWQSMCSRLVMQWTLSYLRF